MRPAPWASTSCSQRSAPAAWAVSTAPVSEAATASSPSRPCCRNTSPRQALLQRFRKEAEAAAQLEHPGIVPVYKLEEADGQSFFTMALVEGRGLDTRLRQGPLDNRRAALVVQRTAEALAHAHKKGVVHRDVKPSNILVDREGGVKVTDFGLARRLDVKDLDTLDEDVRAAHPVTVGTVMRMTQAGVVMGTPGYMAPEQATASSQVGPPADVWAWVRCSTPA